MKIAPYQDGIPVVASTIERNAKFPVPDLNQRVHNLSTNRVERWTGAAWVTDLAPIGQIEVLNVRDFGAVGDGLTDDEVAIQAAFDFAYTNMAAGSTNAIKTVHFPPVPPGKYYRVNKPIWVRGAIAVKGAGHNWNGFKAQSRIGADYAAGPAMLLTEGHAHQAMQITKPGINNAPGSYYHPLLWSDIGFQDATGHTAPNIAYFDFRDCHTFDLNGLAAFALEFTWQAVPGKTQSDQIFFQSVGRWKASEVGEAGCFRLEHTQNSVKAQLRTTNGVFATPVTPNAGNVDNGSPHVIAMDYDGITLRVFVDGQLVGSVAVTGTLVQHDAEGVFLGLQFPTMPYVFYNINSPIGHYGPINFSRVSRHTAPYGPPGNPSGVDSNTIFLTDWTVTKGPMVAGSTYDGTAWIWRRGYAPDRSVPGAGNSDYYLYELTGWEIDGIAIENQKGTTPAKTSGIFIGLSGYGGSMRRVSIINGSRVGIIHGTLGNNYVSRFEHVYVAAWGGRYAYLGGHNDGLSSYDTMWLSNGKVGFAGWVGGKTLRDCFIEMGSDTVYGMLMSQTDVLAPPWNLHGVTFSAEAGAFAPTYKANVLVIHGGLAPTVVTCFGCQFNSLAAATGTPDDPLIETDSPVDPASYRAESGTLITLDSCSLVLLGYKYPVSQIVKATGGLQRTTPVLLRNCNFGGGHVPKKLSSTLGYATQEVKGLRDVPFFLGSGISHDNSVAAVSAANASVLTFTILLANIAQPALIVFVAYKKAGGVAIQAVDLGTVAPFTNLTAISQHPSPGVNGDTVVAAYLIQHHGINQTLTVNVRMTGGVGAGNVIMAAAVSLAGVLPYEANYAIQAIEAPGIWGTSVLGNHTVHQTTYETRRPNQWILEAIAGGGVGVPVPDVGQTQRIAVDHGAGGVDVMGVSTKAVAAAGQGTVGWTLASSAETSTQLALALRAAVPIFDATRAGAFKLLLTGNVAESHLVNMMDGQEITVVIQQDGVGARTFAWPTNVVNAPAVAAGANARTIVRLLWDGSAAVALA